MLDDRKIILSVMVSIRYRQKSGHIMRKKEAVVQKE